jgi:hypothetical protein
VENISQNTEDNGKNSEKLEDSEIIVENNYEDDDSDLELKWESWMHPDFPWDDRQKWINNQKAVQYWLNNKNGSIRELNRIRLDEESKTDNVKTY